MPSYKRPPIVEAVIEVRFQNALTATELGKCQRKLKKKYPVTKNIYKNFGVLIEIVQGGPKSRGFQKGDEGHRLESNDAEWIVMLYPGQLAFVRLAPYTGWDSFLGAFQDVWKIFKGAAGSRRLTRLAVRYINRIDIPLKPGTETIDIADYLNLGVNTPEGMVVDGYEAVLGMNLDENTKAVVRTATQAPAVSKTAALLLDVDLSVHNALPAKDEDMYKRLSWLRDQKNDLFEKFTTDESKELFDKDVV